MKIRGIFGDLKVPKISVIITTYNWPQALRAVLFALMNQSCQDFEIIIADDGSKTETKDLIFSWSKKLNVPLHHVFQEDRGFRASAIRNKAILKANAPYLLFIDGDCVPPISCIEKHLALREKGYFVVGNRVLLSKNFTLQVLSENLRIETWSFWRWMITRIKGGCNRLSPFIRLPLNLLRKMRPTTWKGAMGCHLAIWKEDLLRVNGWEEEYEGWGYEDSDLVVRLIQAGVKRKEARFAIPVIHLWHPIRSREDEAENWKKLQNRKQFQNYSAIKGLNQYQYNQEKVT